MHAALRTLETGERPGDPAPARGRRRQVLAFGLAAVAGVLVAGWHLARPDARAPSQAHAAAQATAVARAVDGMRAIAADPVSATDRELAASSPSPAATSASAAGDPAIARPPAAEAPATPAPSRAAPAAAAPAAVPAPTMAAALPTPSTPAIAVARREAASADADAAEGAEPQAVAATVAALEAAMQRGDAVQAREQLDALARLLPARSLTLLRMRAWFAHRHGDAAEAIAHYRAILDRVPRDATVAINLALLEAGHGDLDSARARLHALRAQGVRSPELIEALAHVEADAP